MARRAPRTPRFTDAIRHRQTGEVPFSESELSPGIMTRILGRPVGVRTCDLPPYDLIELPQRTGIDVAYLATASRFGRIDQRAADGRLVYAGAAVRNRSEMRRLSTPDIEPAARKMESFLEASAPTDIGWVAGLDSSCDIAAAMGCGNYRVKLHEDPGFVQELADRYEAFTLPLTEAALEYRPDAVFLAVEECGRSGPSMSRAHAERLVLGRLRRQLSLLGGSGVPAILHSDGDNSELMARWTGTGFAALHPLEPSGRFDICEVKRRWGDRLALFGNIDVGGVLSRGTPEEVAEDARRHLEELPAGGGYVCGCSHDIDDRIPVGNLRAMVTTVLEWNKAIPPTRTEAAPVP